jgi:hypothetical protein
LEELKEAFLTTRTGEEFVNAIMIGACPTCGSDQTGDCENDPEFYYNILLARCYECGQLWCAECGKLLERKAPFCECWDEER